MERKLFRFFVSSLTKEKTICLFFFFYVRFKVTDLFFFFKFYFWHDESMPTESSEIEIEWE